MGKNRSHFDFLIIGQGLAGSILAHKLMQRGQSVLVVDNKHHGAASMVAAGIINPITGHRLNMTQNFATYYPLARQYYQDCEAQFGVNIWQTIEQTRLIKNPGQLDYFNQRRDQPEYAEVLRREISHHSIFRDSSYGCATIQSTAVVHCQNLLHSIGSFLSQSGNLHAKRVDYSELDFGENKIRFQELSASSIVFCEGYQAINNPWLRKLPFKLSKGEIVTVQTDQPIRSLFNWGHWLLPEFSDSEKTAKLGANYQWQSNTTTATPQIRDELMDSLMQCTFVNAKAIDHQAGVRPSTRERLPFVGPISELDNAYCLNGFGSKGCLLIPDYAERLCQHMLHNSPLPQEVSKCL